MNCATSFSILKVLDAMKKQERCYETKRGLYNEEAGEKRRQLAKWFIQIMKLLRYQRNTVAIAMNILDRVLTVRNQIIFSNHLIQLAATASLYISVKISEQLVLIPSQLSDICKGLFSSTEIEQMEFDILKILDWRVNPPTALSFANEYLKLFLATGAINPNERDAISNIAGDQIFQAITDSDFVGFAASGIAFTAICNATTMLVDVKIPNVLQVELLPQPLENQLLGCILPNSDNPRRVISPKEHQQAGNSSSKGGYIAQRPHLSHQCITMS